VTAVWACAELGADGPQDSAFELVTKARQLGQDVAAVAFGPGAAAAAAELGTHGAATLYAGEDEAFVTHPGSAAHALAELAREHTPDLILFPMTYESRDVAGRLQALLGCTLMSNATDVLAPDRARTEFAGGATSVDVELDGPSPRLVLVRPRSVAASPAEGSGPARVVEVGAGDLPAHATAPTLLEHHDEAAAGPDLGAAKVVIAGGRGLGGPDAFAMLDELAAAIGGAAVGASRAAVDAGWVPYRYQIGQTGITVAPEVYLAFGISGALQHAVGMKTAKRIVAVNRDADAPIMAMADLAVVGDLFQILPALTEEIRRRRASA
jgi:electron transfer flavoprotein alpha subunit